MMSLELQYLLKTTCKTGAPDSEVAEEQLVPMVMSDCVLPLSSDPKVYFKKKKPYSPSSGMSQYIFPFV
jgi:hypothetical protein